MLLHTFKKQAHIYILLIKNKYKKKRGGGKKKKKKQDHKQILNIKAATAGCSWVCGRRVAVALERGGARRS